MNTDRSGRTFDPVANAKAHRCIHGHAPPCLYCVMVGAQAAFLRKAFARIGKPR